jgi:hypothetical protein
LAGSLSLAVILIVRYEVSGFREQARGSAGVGEVGRREQGRGEKKADGCERGESWPFIIA